MEIQYKPSMFNRIVEKNDGMAIYNCRTGVAGIKLISENNQKKILHLLNSVSAYTDDVVYKKLVDGKFLVPLDTDEKLIRKYIQTQSLTDSILH